MSNYNFKHFKLSLSKCASYLMEFKLVWRIFNLQTQHGVLCGQHQFRLAVGGFYNPLPLQDNWFWGPLNMADSPRGYTKRVTRKSVERVI